MNAETQQSIRRAPAPVLVPPASFTLAGAGSAPRPHTADAAPRVVIVGAGFAGLTAAQALKGAPAQVILIDRRNHHLFQPLLYQVATAGLSPADVAVPTRGILRRQHNAKTLL